MIKKYMIGVAGIFLLLLSISCNATPPDELDEPAPELNEVPPTSAATDQPQPEPTIAAAEKATYELYFDASWSAETHPADYVASAHFSPFIAYGHTDSPDALIFSENEIVTTGIEQMAETGATDLLIGEIEVLIDIQTTISRDHELTHREPIPVNLGLPNP